MTAGIVWLIQMPPRSCSYIAYCNGRKMMNTRAPNLTTSDMIFAFCASCFGVQSGRMNWRYTLRVKRLDAAIVVARATRPGDGARNAILRLPRRRCNNRSFRTWLGGLAPESFTACKLQDTPSSRRDAKYVRVNVSKSGRSLAHCNIPSESRLISIVGSKAILAKSAWRSLYPLCGKSPCHR
jgi:hypothetical protein